MLDTFTYSLSYIVSMYRRIFNLLTSLHTYNFVNSFILRSWKFIPFSYRSLRSIGSRVRLEMCFALVLARVVFV